MSNRSSNQDIEDIIEMGEQSLSLSEIQWIANNAKIRQFYEFKFQDKLYSAILLSLTHEVFPEPDAKKLWNRINEHLQLLNSRLDRDVGIVVAALDYLLNIEAILSQPKIIEENKSNYITEASTIDELTELYLRDIFDIVLNKEWEDSHRGQSSLCLLMIDIDDFKQVNDLHGHQVGDEVLKKIGQTINQHVREMDLAARYGGEELSIIMPNTDLQEAAKVAERLLKSVEQLRFDDFNVTISIGVAQNNSRLENASELIKLADQALYDAKHRGKNQVVRAAE